MSAPRAPLSRRLFVRRAGRVSAVLWLGPWLRCGDGSVGPNLDSGPDASPPMPRESATAPDASADAALDADHGDSAQPGLDADVLAPPEPRDAATAVDASADAAPSADPDYACEPLLTPWQDYPVLFGGSGTIEAWQQPELSAQAYRLSITGSVGTTLQLSLDDLEAYAESNVTVLKTMQCVFGPTGTALWTGIPLRLLLDRADIDRTRTRRLLFTGADGFRNNLRLEDLYGEPSGERFEPLLALRFNGEPLANELGYPARLLLPDRYGFKNIKWLTNIEATESDESVGQYQSLMLSSDLAFIVPNSLYKRKYREQPGWPGLRTLCGQALSGQGGIDRVEISIDSADFEPTRLRSLEDLRSAEPELANALQVAEDWPFPYLGVAALWEYDWVGTPGEHTIVLRIFDRGGHLGDSYRTTLVIED